MGKIILDGKTVLITGGSSGIGKAAAMACVKNGANVVVLSKNAEQVDQAVREIKTHCAGPSKVTGFVADILDVAQLKKVFESIGNHFSNIDILINNAGFATYKTFSEMSHDEIAHITNVNYLGHLNVSKFVLTQMEKQGHGHVINVASVAGRIPITPNCAYSAAKHGLVAMTDLLRCEYAQSKIYFSLYLPGRVDTPFFDHPTFKSRTLPRESKQSMSAEAAAKDLLKIIRTRQRELVNPIHFKLIIWAQISLGWFIKPLYWKLLEKRVATHRRDVEKKRIS